MSHWRRPRPRTAKRSPSQILALREARRTSAISAAIGELHRKGGQIAIDHTMIAEQTGLPVEFIQWRYPSLESLLHVADLGQPLEVLNI
jgi:DNA-binding transcriptional regulator YbjK